MGAIGNFDLDPSWLERKLQAGPVRLSRLHAMLTMDVGLDPQSEAALGLPSFSEVRWMLGAMARNGEVTVSRVTQGGPDILITLGAPDGDPVTLEEVLAGFPPGWPADLPSDLPVEIWARGPQVDFEAEDENEALRRLGF